MLTYCDSVILIYYLDTVGPFNVRATNRLTTLLAAGDRIAASDLSRLECRVKPIRLGHSAVLTRFDTFFTLPDVQIVPLTTAVYDRATDIRARHSFRTTDALHLAAAIEAGCGSFLTHDLRLSKFTDIPVELLP